MAASEDVRQTLAGLSPEKRALLALKLRRQADGAESAREGWLEGERREVCIAYWRGRLAGAPVLELPADAGAPASIPARRQARRSLGLPRPLVEAVARLGRAEEVGAFEVLLAAWAALLARWTGAADLLIGTPMGGNPVGLRLSAAGDPPFRELLRQVREEVAAARLHADLPFAQLADALGGRTGGPAGDLFQVMLAIEEPGATPKVSPAGRKPEMLLGVVAGEGRLHSYLDYQPDRLTDAGAMRALHHFKELLAAATAGPERRLSQLTVLTEAERHQITVEWNEASGPVAGEEIASVPGLFAEAARRAHDAVALACGGESRTYGELARGVLLLAQALRRRGFGPGAVASVEVEEPFDRIAGILAVLQAGGAWLAIPEPPAAADPVLRLDASLLRSSEGEGGLEGAEERLGSPEPDSPACVTEARVGLERTPVPVSHRALVGRLRALDGLAGARDIAGETFLAAADTSADGALAWLWPLSRGARVRLLSTAERRGGSGSLGELDFSLFFFAGDGASGSPEKYRLLLESARFADREGFNAIWTPERHFHPFGGLYPNPAVTGAALAEATRRVQIRAGSLVIPLHEVDEALREWADVDAIAGGGRVGIAFASGWHVDDFVLLPANYAVRREAMDQGIERMRTLWPGELPFWITSSGNVETFAKAGRLGAGVLTNLLGQGLDAVAEKLAAYRAARAEAGYAGGSAALMLHTFVGEDLDEVRETVRDPFCRYLRGFSDLFRQLARNLNYKAQDELNEADVDYLMSFAFQRYFDTASLCGTPESCLAMLRRVRDAGVDEIACLIDFGVDEDAVLASLHHLAELRRLCRERSGRVDADFGLAALAGEVTALVGTRSLLGRLGEDPGFPALLGGLRLFVADRQAPFPSSLSTWSLPEAGLVAAAPGGQGKRPLGRPLAGTSLHLLSASGDPVPVGIAGEVYVGGDGLAAGYPACPDRTGERFVPDPFSDQPGGRLFRTGEGAVRRADGSLDLPARRPSGAAR